MPHSAAKTTQFTVPLTSLSVGPHGPFTSGLLPASLVGYELDFTNDDTWPTTNDVITVTVETSNDSGNTWSFDASITLGGVWKTKAGVIVHTSSWSVGVDNQGSTTRKIRVTLNVLQACTIGAVISSL